jgi:hypothetical protein
LISSLAFSQLTDSKHSVKVSKQMKTTTQISSKSAKPQPSPPVEIEEDEQELLKRFFCALLSGVSSQLELYLDDPDGCSAPTDIFSDSDRALRDREEFLAARAFRMAVYALEEWKASANFNSQCNG